LDFNGPIELALKWLIHNSLSCPWQPELDETKEAKQNYAWQ
jgi:hypothetical protein